MWAHIFLLAGRMWKMIRWFFCLSKGKNTWTGTSMWKGKNKWKREKQSLFWTHPTFHWSGGVLEEWAEQTDFDLLTFGCSIYSPWTLGSSRWLTILENLTQNQQIQHMLSQQSMDSQHVRQTWDEMKLPRWGCMDEDGGQIYTMYIYDVFWYLYKYNCMCLIYVRLMIHDK